MQHLDEGTIHAWLDGALDAAEVARVEQHARACASCAAAVAEARGLVAGASRILSALDQVPGNVVPSAGGGGGGPEHDIGSAMARRRARAGEGTLWRALRLTPARAAAAAVLIVAAGTVIVARQQGDRLAVQSVEMVSMDTTAQGPAVSTPAIAPSAVGGGTAKAPVDARSSGERAGRPGSRSEGLPLAQAPAPQQDSSAARRPARPAAADLAKARREEVSAANVPTAQPIPTVAAAPNERRADAFARGRVAGAPVVVSSSRKAEVAAMDSVRVTEREAPERRAARSLAPVPAPPANVAAMRDQVRQGAVRDTQPADSARVIAVAGCYAVTSDRPAGLPARISLDTASTVGGAAGFAAPVTPPTAQSAAAPMARRLESVPIKSRESAVERRVTLPASSIAGVRGALLGSWLKPSPSTVRVTLGSGTTPATVLVLQVDDASTLRGFVVGSEVVVTLRRAGCGP